MVGQTISHYKILSKLGEGGMGVVYKAEDTKLGRAVALKFLAAHLLKDEEARGRFHREARAAASLNHPNVCTVHEIGEANGRTFIVMEFVEGESLDRRIEQGPLQLTEALDAARQVANQELRRRPIDELLNLLPQAILVHVQKLTNEPKRKEAVGAGKPSVVPETVEFGLEVFVSAAPSI